MLFLAELIAFLCTATRCIDFNVRRHSCEPSLAQLQIPFGVVSNFQSHSHCGRPALQRQCHRRRKAGRAEGGNPAGQLPAAAAVHWAPEHSRDRVEIHDPLQGGRRDGREHQTDPHGPLSLPRELPVLASCHLSIHGSPTGARRDLDQHQTHSQGASHLLSLSWLSNSLSLQFSPRLPSLQGQYWLLQLQGTNHRSCESNFQV